VICKLHGCDHEVVVDGVNKVGSIYDQGAFLLYFPSPRLTLQSADGEMTPWLTRLAVRRYRSCLNAYLALISDCGGEGG